MLSRLATLIDNPHIYRKRTTPIYGLTYHTTGSDPVLHHGAKSPLQFTVDYYRSKHGPTYVIDWDGGLYATTPDESIRTTNVWIKPAEAQAFVDGSWTRQMSAKALEQWRRRWPNAQSPLDIRPKGVHQGESYIAVEMIPIRVGSKYYGGQKAAYPGAYFTKAQHETAAALAIDVAKRYKFPAGWERTSRLVGHEDLNPLRRHTSTGMWDPGWSNTPPHFSLAYLQEQIAASRVPRGWLYAGLGMVAVAGAYIGYRVYRRK